MEAKELRLGNYVKISNELSIIKVSSINIDSVWVDDLESIPINEEWLLRFGFEWNDTMERYMIGKWSSLQICKTLDIELSGYYFNHIKYVHQLQNFYFALTGEELTIVSEGKK